MYLLLHVLQARVAGLPCVTLPTLLYVLQVRVAGLSGLVALCQLLPGDAQVAHMLPLVRRHMQPLELALPLQRALAAAFPDLLAAVRVTSVHVIGLTLPTSQCCLMCSMCYSDLCSTGTVPQQTCYFVACVTQRLCCLLAGAE